MNPEVKSAFTDYFEDTAKHQQLKDVD